MPEIGGLHRLPEGLPVPTDDGAADHLRGARLPSVPLAATSGGTVDLAALRGTTVIYCYPMTGPPDGNLPQNWDEIPGARGCTPQSCSFRDHNDELAALDARVFGLSTQDTAYQREAAERLDLPFDLLGDGRQAFVAALGLPTFEVEGMILTKRLTMIVEDGRIVKVFYPVFPPDRNAGEVLRWLSSRAKNDPEE